MRAIHEEYSSNSILRMKGACVGRMRFLARVMKEMNKKHGVENLW